MRKALTFVLLSGLFLIPLAAYADNVGVASATIDFDAVVNMLIDQDWSDITITQPLIDTYFSTPAASMPIAWGAGSAYNIKVTVQALSNFAVYSGYSSKSSGFDALVGTKSSFIALKDLPAGSPGYINYVADASLPTFTGLTVPGPDTGTHSETDAAVAAAFTSLSGWSGVNNLPTGEFRTYDVFWNPHQLTGDFDTSDSLNIDIYFLVTDPTI